jgi:hypothetical protein
MSQISVDSVIPQSGTTVTLGASGDTISVPSGVTLTNNGTASGFGKVLQTVSTSYATAESTTSTSYVDSSLVATITPASSSNKILIFVSTAWITTHASNPAADARIYNSTDAVTIIETHAESNDAGGGNIYQAISCSMVGEDTGRSVATTYKLQHKASSAGRNSNLQYGDRIGWIILMEVEA